MFSDNYEIFEFTHLSPQYPLFPLKEGWKDSPPLLDGGGMGVGEFGSKPYLVEEEHQ